MRVVVLVGRAEILGQRGRVEPQRAAARVLAADQAPGARRAEQAILQCLVAWVSGASAYRTGRAGDAAHGHSVERAGASSRAATRTLMNAAIAPAAKTSATK